MFVKQLPENAWCDSKQGLVKHRYVSIHRSSNFLKTYEWTLSLLRSKTTFFQTFKKKCTHLLVRIGSIIIFRLSKLWQVKFFILFDVIVLVRLQEKFEIDRLLGTTGLEMDHKTEATLRPVQGSVIVDRKAYPGMSPQKNWQPFGFNLSKICRKFRQPLQHQRSRKVTLRPII